MSKNDSRTSGGEYLQDLSNRRLCISDFHISCIGFEYCRQANGTFGQVFFTIHLPHGQRIQFEISKPASDVISFHQIQTISHISCQSEVMPRGSYSCFVIAQSQSLRDPTTKIKFLNWSNKYIFYHYYGSSNHSW